MGKKFDAIKKSVSLATKIVIETRQGLCESCDFAKYGICKKCGCVIKMKTQFVNAKCPIGKW